MSSSPKTKTKTGRRIPNRSDMYGLTLADRELRVANTLRALQGDKVSTMEILSLAFDDVLRKMKELYPDPTERAQRMALYADRLDGMILRCGTLYGREWPWSHIVRERRRIAKQRFEFVYSWSDMPRPGQLAKSRVWGGGELVGGEARNGTKPVEAVELEPEHDDTPVEVQVPDIMNPAYFLPKLPMPDEPLAELVSASVDAAADMVWEQVGITGAGEPILRRDGVLYRVLPL